MSKTKKVPLADVLWRAANTLNPKRVFLGPRQFTCTQVARIELGRREDPCSDELEGCKGVRFMRKLGCPFCAQSVDSWRELSEDAIQGVRYMWLLLAMHVAEDEGIMVEVPA